jgi:shikimate dehydrogenase
VVFDQGAAFGYNTDHSGFIEAYRRVRGEVGRGATLLIGTGGVGRAVAFGLVTLSAAPIRLVDRDTAKAKALAADLRHVSPDLDVSVLEHSAEAARDVQGIINCTPLGMFGHEGSPLPRCAMAGAEWAFDAVYTPSDTRFLTDAEAEGLAIISGWELFFYQGVHAWDIFSGCPLDAATLRRDLLSDGNAPSKL